MAVDDCKRRLERAGYKITPADDIRLEELLAEGLTDAEATRQLIIEQDQRIVDIAKRSRREGGSLTPVVLPIEQVLTKRQEVLAKQLERVQNEREAINERVDQANIRYAELNFVVNQVRNTGRDLYKLNVGAEEDFNVKNDQSVLRVLESMLFTDRRRDQRVLEKIGLKGRDPLTLLESFRKVEAEMDIVRDELAGLQEELDSNSERLNTIFGGEQRNPDLDEYNQEMPRLQALHNLTGENLAFADELGGIAMPSVAVTPEGISHANMGEITLIGRSNLGDPKQVPVYDADTYSGRMPQPTYDNPSQSAVDRLLAMMRPWATAWEEPSAYGNQDYRRLIDYTFDDLVNSNDPSPGVSISRWSSSPAMMAWFLSEFGVELDQPQQVDRQPTVSWSIWSDVAKFFRDADFTVEQYPWEDPRRQKLYKDAGKVVRKAMEQHAADMVKQGLETDAEVYLNELLSASNYFDEEGRLVLTIFDKIKADQDIIESIQDDGVTLQRVPSERLNKRTLQSYIEQNRLEPDFHAWMTDKIEPLFGDPYIKLGNRKVPYTLDNIVERMRRDDASRPGTEDHMVFGEGMARAVAATKISDLTEARNRAEWQIADDQTVSAARDNAKRLMEEYRNDVVNFYAGRTWRGSIDTWEALDDSMRAIAFWAKNRLRLGDEEALRQGLRQHDFHNVPDWVIEKGLEAGNAFMEAPVPYFEAKPERGVALEEFAGAVIPHTASPETRAILMKHNIVFREYQAGGPSDQQHRQAALARLQEQLANAGERTYFQSDIGFYSALNEAVKMMPQEKMQAGQFMSWLKKQPGVTKQELEWLDIEGFANLKGTVTKAEITEYVERNGVQIEETLLGENFVQPDPYIAVEFYRGEEGDYHALGIEPEAWEYTEVWTAQATMYGDQYYVIHDTDAGNVYVRQLEEDNYLEVYGVMNNQGMDDARRTIERDVQERLKQDMDDEGLGGPAVYAQHRVEGGTNYTEHLLHMPEVPEQRVRYSGKLKLSEGAIRTLDDGTEVEIDLDDDIIDQAMNMLDASQGGRFDVNVYRVTDERGDLSMEFEGLNEFEYEEFASYLSNLGLMIYDEESEAFRVYSELEDPFNERGSRLAFNYTTGHFGEVASNIIAWFRTTERVGPNNERVLFIEEIQSSLHQAGFEFGYKPSKREILAKHREYLEADKIATDKYSAALGGLQRIVDWQLGLQDFGNDVRQNKYGDQKWYIVDRTGEWGTKPYDTREAALEDAGAIRSEQEFRDLERTFHDSVRLTIKENATWVGLNKLYDPDEMELTDQEISLINDWREARLKADRLSQEDIENRREGLSPPDFPFKAEGAGRGWVSLAIKRIIRHAVDNGYDRVAFSTGDTQNEHYNRLRQIKQITLRPNVDSMNRVNGYNLQAQDIAGDWFLDESVYTREDLAAYIGNSNATEMWTKVEQFEAEAAAFYDVIPAEEAYIDPDDTFVHETYGDNMRDGIQMYVAVDPNGEIVRETSGDYRMESDQDELYDTLMREYYENMYREPLEMSGEQILEGVIGGNAFRNFYDGEVVNMANRAVSKLDKKLKVKRFDDDAFNLGYMQQDDVRVREEVPGMIGTKFYVERRKQTERPGDMTKWERVGEAFDNLPDAKDAAARVRQESMRMKRYQAHTLDLTELSKQKVRKGQTLFQNHNGKRGSINFDEENRAYINLFRSRNMSTFLHESGHLFFELMADLAEMPSAPQQTIDDYTALLRKLGVNSREEVGTREHELMARMFEAYLREGKAPDPELQSTFSAFRSWLMTIYRTVERLLGRHQIDDDIRGIFDRLIATDEAISRAETMQQYVSLFSSAEEMGVPQEQFDLYRENMSEAHQEAMDAEVAKMMEYTLRQEKKVYLDERKKMQAAVEEEAYAQRVYKALSFLQRGKAPDGSELVGPGGAKIETFKISKDSLVRLFGQEFLKRLPGRGKYSVYSVEGGTDVEAAAEYFGYSSPQAMVEELIRAIPMRQWIRQEVNKRMDDFFPDPVVDGTLQEDAMRVVHNERRARIMAAEMRALRRKMLEDKKVAKAERDRLKREDRERRQAFEGYLPKRGELALIKAAAKAAIAEEQYRNVNPNKYRVAEQRAARRAFDAMARRDYETAYQEQRKRLINAEMYRASLRAKEAAEKTRRYVKRFETTKVRQRLGKAGFLEQADAIIDGFNFRQISKAQVDREKAMAEMLQAVEDGRLVVPPEVLAKLQDLGTNWQDLKINELLGMRDILRQLEHQARNQYTAIINGEKKVIKDVANELIQAVVAHTEAKPLGIGSEEKTGSTKDELVEGFWLASSSLARILDASDWGAWTKNIIAPIREAYASRMLPGFQKIEEDMTELYLKHFNDDELSAMNSERIHVQAMGESFTKGELLSLALNWGNEGNRRVVLEGRKANGEPAFPEAGVRAMLALLNGKDWAFVQDVWDYMDTYWPALAEKEQQRRGIAPEKVEASPFKIRTADGLEVTVKGGYYPIKYDPRHSETVQINELEDVMKKMGNGLYVTGNTRAGSTFERTNQRGKVVRLGLNIIDQHLREVVRDVAIGDEVNAIKRILADPDLRRTLRETGNEHVIQSLNLWLTDAAVGELPAQGAVERILAWTRTGWVKSRMAWNLVTTALQFTGVFQTAAVVGTAHYTRAVAKMAQNPKLHYEQVFQMSDFMRLRYVTGSFNKDVNDTRAHLNAELGTVPTKLKRNLDAVSATYFKPIMYAQSVVDVSTWMAGYDKGRNVKNLSHEEAIRYADSVVEGTQTSGFFSDRSNLERGTVNKKTRQSQFIRIWTTLISYMLKKGNIAYEKGVAVKREGLSFKTAIQFGMDMLLLFTVEGLVSAFLYGNWPDEDDDEPFAWFAAKVTFDSWLSGIPFLRETSSVRFGGGNTVIGAATRDMYRFYQQAAQGEVDKTLVKSFINLTGTFGHYPAAQINRFVDAAWDESQGEDVAFYEYMIGTRDD